MWMNAGAGDATMSHPHPEHDALSPEGAYVEHGPLMRRVAILRFGVPPAVADELVQDVFLNYLLSPTRVHTSLRAYLIGGVANACRNYWRSQRSEGRVFSDRPPERDQQCDDPFDRRLAAQLMAKATLARLTPRCREVLGRYYLRDEDTPTIASALNTTAGNVNYLMHKCRKRAREIYSELTANTDGRTNDEG